MPSQLQLLQQATMRLDVKASIWLSRLRVVPKFVPILDIRNMVSPATRKLIDDPPPQSSWMPGAAIIELDAALYDLRGADAVDAWLHHLALCALAPSGVALRSNAIGSGVAPIGSVDGLPVSAFGATLAFGHPALDLVGRAGQSVTEHACTVGRDYYLVLNPHTQLFLGDVDAGLQRQHHARL